MGKGGMGGMEVKHGETMQFLCENYGMETKSFRGPIVLKVYGSIWWSTFIGVLWLLGGVFHTFTEVLQ